MVKVYGKITFTVKQSHPDLKYIPVKEQHESITIEDTYSFNKERYGNNFSDYMKEYIQNDLILIANGGYENSHINILNLVVHEVE